MPTSRDIITLGVVPAVITLLLAGAAVLFSRRRDWNPRGVATAAVGIAFVVGTWATFGRPAIPPLDGTDWVFYLAAVIGAIGLLDVLLPEKFPGGAAVGPLLCAIATGVAVGRMNLSLLHGPVLQPWVILPGLGAGIVALLLMRSMHVLAGRGGYVVMPLVLGLTVLAAVPVIADDIAAKLAQQAGILAAAAGGIWLVITIGFKSNASRELSANMAAPVVSLLISLLAAGWLFSSVKPNHIALLLIAPMLAWIGEDPRLPRWRILRASVSVAAVVAALAVLVFPAVKALMAEMADA